MIPIYRWRIQKGSDEPIAVHPVYKDDLSLNYEKESQQRFFRAKLSSKIDFIAEDADMIIAAPFETKFTLLLDMSSDMGLTFSQYYASQFYKTDCTINYDDRKVSVQPEAQDRYNDVLAGLDKEYNLIELAPAIQPIQLTKRPMFQLYNVGESTCNCFCGGQAFEVDMADTSEERVRECGFRSMDASWEFNFPNPPVAGFSQPFVGFFHGNGSEFWATDTTYYLVYYEDGGTTNGILIKETATGRTLWQYEQFHYPGLEDIPAEFTFNVVDGSYSVDVGALTSCGGYIPPSSSTQKWTQSTTVYGAIIDVTNYRGRMMKIVGNSNVGYYAFVKAAPTWNATIQYATGYTVRKTINANQTQNVKIPDDAVYLWVHLKGAAGVYTPQEITFYYPQLTVYKAAFGIYGRLVTDRDDVQGWNVSKLSTDDVVANNRNYHYSVPFTDFTATQSVRTSVEPTKWGRNDAGQYFLPPDDTHEWYPVGRSQWVNVSVWVQYSSDMASIEVTGRKEFVLKDAFPVWSVIEVLLNKVAPSVTHKGTSAYSDFLYGTARGQAIFGGDIQLFLAPKSNIIVGEYQEPAMKAPVTLGEVLKMLHNMYGCYWFIDEQNRLRIEHIEWFKRGGSYTGEPVIGIDLTDSYNLRNGKDWAFCTSEIKFKKEDMPARYEYEWMDDCTEVFNGTIDVLSTFVKEDKVEEVTVSGYTSDVDYMLMAPNMCSKDGFALLGAKLVSGVYAVPIVSMYFGEYTKSIQNYYLSMAFLLPNYLISDMPAWNIKIGETQTVASGIQRNKQQQLKFPAVLEDTDFNKLVRTHIGDGEIDRLEMSLSSRMAKVQLNYNTYDRE